MTLGVEREGRLSQRLVGDAGVNAPGIDVEPIGGGTNSVLGLVGVRGGAGEAGRSSGVGSC
jgi:hypothetical protein